MDANTPDVSMHNQVAIGGTPYTLDVSAAPDPSASDPSASDPSASDPSASDPSVSGSSALVPAGSEPVLQLRALEHAGDPERQQEFFKIFMTDDAAVQVQAVLRLEEGDTGLDLLYPPAAPNWGLRVENMPDHGTCFTRLDVESRTVGGDSLAISAEEASALADRIEVARRERQTYSNVVHSDGSENALGS